MQIENKSDLTTVQEAVVDPSFWSLKLIQSLGPSLRNNEKNCEYKIRDEIEGP
jgi:hypothetical protein